MTALKPIENRRVRGVASTSYELNRQCAHPECTEPAVDPHHIFPRSEIGNDSWFVEITDDEETVTIAHVAGLCRLHHDQVEEHAAWIKLEDKRVFVWYDRVSHYDPPTDSDSHPEEWVEVGILNPHPGSVEGKPKRRKFKGQARRQRKTISIKVPQDEQEDGAGLWDDAIEALEAKRVNDESHRPPYYTIMDALNYAILNSGPEDF